VAVGEVTTVAVGEVARKVITAGAAGRSGEDWGTRSDVGLLLEAAVEEVDVEEGVVGAVATRELNAFGLWERGTAVTGNDEVGAHGVELRFVVLGVVQSQDLVPHNVFTALKALREGHSYCRASFREKIRAPDTRDWASLDATRLLELDKGELLGVGLRAFSWALREVGHHGTVVVVRALSSVARGPEARAVPVDDHCGPSLGRSRGLSWTRNLVAGDIWAVDIAEGSVTSGVWPNNRWRSSGGEYVHTREVNTVNGDFADGTVAQNATQMDSGGEDGGVLDFSEHGRR